MKMVCFRNEYQSVRNRRAASWIKNKGMLFVFSSVLMWSWILTIHCRIFMQIFSLALDIDATSFSTNDFF
jgi:hypothetical protein